MLDAPPPPHQPNSFLRDVVMLQEDQNDPALDIPGTPPNFSRYVVPHVVTFQGFMSTISNTYRDYDEAIKDSLDNARFMRNDCGLMECIEARQRGTALLKWHLEPEDPKSVNQRDLCTKLTKIIQRIRRFTEYRRCLLEAIWYGKYAIQHRLAYGSIEGTQRIYPKPLRENDGWQPINGDKLVFRFDTERNQRGQWPYQLGIRVGASYQVDGKVENRWKVEVAHRSKAYFPSEFERRMLVVHKHMIEDGAYEDLIGAGAMHGVGIRSRIYWEWVQKQETLAFLIEFLERSAGGIEIWKYPQGNADAKEEVTKSATRRQGSGRNALIVPIPFGDDGMQYGVQIVEPGFQGIDVVQNMLDKYFGHRIKRYILGQTLTSEADATGLGSGLAELHLDSFMQVIRYDATNLEETLTSDLVEPLKNWNFQHARDVHIRFAIETETPDAKEKLEAVHTGWQMGARINEQSVLDLIGISAPTDTDLVLPSPQQQQTMAGGMGIPGATGSQAQVPADIDTSPEGMAQEMTAQLTGQIPDGAPSMYVAEGDQLVKRQLPDEELDTGDRHRVETYAKNHWENQSRVPAGSSEGGRWASHLVAIIDASDVSVPKNRKEAIGKLKALRGVYRNEHRQWDVSVSTSSLRHCVYRHTTDLRPLFKIPQLVQGAIHFATAPARQEEDLSAHTLFAPVKMDAAHLAKLTVVESKPHTMLVTRFRLHHLGTEKAEKLANKQAGVGDADPQSSAGEQSFSIGSFREAVKEFLREKKNKAAAPAQTSETSPSDEGRSPGSGGQNHGPDSMIDTASPPDEENRPAESGNTEKETKHGGRPQ